MVSMTKLAHEIIRASLGEGGLAIDGTAGNGHDTLVLAQLVGPTGRVWAFDVQPQALESTRNRLLAHKCHHVVELVHASHSELMTVIPQRHHGEISGIMFNLGYLPHHDHALTTRCETTIPAIQAALSLLRSGGALTVMTYRGHPGGEEEASAVESLLDGLDPDRFATFRWPEVTPTRGPRLSAVKKLLP
jgi:predicted methyltransferase